MAKRKKKHTHTDTVRVFSRKVQIYKDISLQVYFSLQLEKDTQGSVPMLSYKKNDKKKNDIGRYLSFPALGQHSVYV